MLAALGHCMRCLIYAWDLKSLSKDAILVDRSNTNVSMYAAHSGVYEMVEIHIICVLWISLTFEDAIFSRPTI